MTDSAVHSDTTCHLKNEGVRSQSTSTHRYLVIANISKRNNVRFLLNAAAAYLFTPILVSATPSEYEHLPSAQRAVVAPTLAAAVEFLRAAPQPVRLIGIEIEDSALAIGDFCALPAAQRESVAFMPGNEGTGLSKQQKAVCDGFVYIPQYGGGTASFNVYVATTIVLHHYNHALIRDAQCEKEAMYGDGK